MRKLVIRRLVAILLILLLIPIVWFVQSRLLASRRAISLRTMGTDYPAPANSKRLKIGTYNIAHGRGGKYGASNWTGWSKEQSEEHLRKIANQLKETNLDIVILNEVDLDSSWSSNVNQAEFIARAAGYPFIATQRNLDAAVPFFSIRCGNAILSHYPLSDLRVIGFPVFSKWETIFAGNHDGLLCTAKTPLGNTRIMAVHLEYRSETIRVKSAKLIAEVARQTASPLIVLGDFNSAPKGFHIHEKTTDGENAMDYLMGEGGFGPAAKDQFPKTGLTFPSENPDRVIDWILTTSQLEEMDRAVNPSTLSDHRMLSVTIQSPLVR